MLHQFYVEDDGATSIEYSLVAVILAVATIAAITLIGTRLSRSYNTIATSVPS
jgi:pilus assembly protein Flp/PilA